MFYLSLTPHYAADYSVGMALIDMIPVILFLLTGIILLLDLRTTISSISYAFLSAGSIMVFFAGLFKSVWKIIAALNICDFAAFNLMFFPVSSFGFLFFAIGTSSLLMTSSHNNKLFSLAPTTFLLSTALEMTNSSVPFLALQTIASTAGIVFIIIFAFRNHAKLAAILMLISIVFLWGMGGLAAMEGHVSVALWNWLEELDNIICQALLLTGVWVLHKSNTFHTCDV